MSSREHLYCRLKYDRNKKRRRCFVLYICTLHFAQSSDRSIFRFSFFSSLFRYENWYATLACSKLFCREVLLETIRLKVLDSLSYDVPRAVITACSSYSDNILCSLCHVYIIGVHLVTIK